MTKRTAANNSPTNSGSPSQTGSPTTRRRARALKTATTSPTSNLIEVYDGRHFHAHHLAGGSSGGSGVSPVANKPGRKRKAGSNANSAPNSRPGSRPGTPPSTQSNRLRSSNPVGSPFELNSDSSLTPTSSHSDDSDSDFDMVSAAKHKLASNSVVAAAATAVKEVMQDLPGESEIAAGAVPIPAKDEGEDAVMTDVYDGDDEDKKDERTPSLIEPDSSSPNHDYDSPTRKQMFKDLEEPVVIQTMLDQPTEDMIRGGSRSPVKRRSESLSPTSRKRVRSESADPARSPVSKVTLSPTEETSSNDEGNVNPSAIKSEGTGSMSERSDISSSSGQNVQNYNSAEMKEMSHKLDASIAELSETADLEAFITKHELGASFLHELHKINDRYEKRLKIADEKLRLSVANFDAVYNATAKLANDTFLDSKRKVHNELLKEVTSMKYKLKYEKTRRYTPIPTETPAFTYSPEVTYVKRQEIQTYVEHVSNGLPENHGGIPIWTQELMKRQRKRGKTILIPTFCSGLTESEKADDLSILKTLTLKTEVSWIHSSNFPASHKTNSFIYGHFTLISNCKMTVVNHKQILHFNRKLISINLETINLEQFVYFKHVLESRRKGKPLPVGVPLNIKEKFLKGKQENRMFTRVDPRARNPGASLTKNAAELEKELALLDTEMEKADRERMEIDEKLALLTTSKEELLGLAEYKKKHLAAIRDDVTHLREGLKQLQQQQGATSGATSNDILRVGDDLISSLLKEKEALEARRRNLMNEMAQI
ncbi:hypothetical protein HDV05_000741 [Chytridiales sp. JEL 0842]|nr:hypothetical protein HDV05_000741 [Chytridiales sp. JEL 0842]